MPAASATTAACRRRPRGFAMLLVLMLTSIAIVVVAELAYQSGLELLAAANVSDIGAIEYAIDGQFEVVLGNLRFDKKQNDQDGEFDSWNSGEIRSRRDGDVALTTRVFDEQGKFNLMRLIQGTDAQRTHAREIFVRILDLFREGISEDKSKGGDLDPADAEDVADRVIRYLKRDGASGQVPKPKTVPADVPLLVDELLFVDTKDSHIMSVLMDDMNVKGNKVAPGLQRYVTIYGTQKINLNTAPVVVLKALFSNAADRDYAQGIVDRRRSQASDTTGKTGSTGKTSGTGTGTDASAQGNPFTDVNQLSDGSVQGLTADVLDRNGIRPAEEFDVKSDYFSVRIQGATDRTQRDELYVVQRVKTDGFVFLLHQERTDPLLDVGDDVAPSSGQ